MRPGRIVMLVLGTLSALLGLGLLAGAGAVGWANYQQRDNGFFTTPVERFAAEFVRPHFSTPRHHDGKQLPGNVPGRVPGSIMLRGSAADPAKAIFIGIAPQADVAAYLAGVNHSEIVDVRFAPFRVQYRELPGTSVPAPPADQTFWTALGHRARGPRSSSGTCGRGPGPWSS